MSKVLEEMAERQAKVNIVQNRASIIVFGCCVATGILFLYLLFQVVAE